MRNFCSYVAELEHQNVLELSLEQQQRLDGHLDSELADLSKCFDIDRYRIARTTFAGHARDLGPVPLPNASVLPGNSSSAPRYAVTPRYGAGSSLGSLPCAG